MDLDICGTELAKGGICVRKGNKPDGRCYQHCASEYRTKKAPSSKEAPQTFSQRQKEFEDNLVQRMRSMLVNNLRESEDRMSKILSRQVDELRLTNLVQGRLINLYEKIIQEKVSPDDFKNYILQVVPGSTGDTGGTGSSKGTGDTGGMGSSKGTGDSNIPLEIPTGQDLEEYIRSVALVEAGFTEKEYEGCMQMVTVENLPPPLLREEEDKSTEELSFEEKEKLYSRLASQSMQHSEEEVLPEGFMEKYKLLFPKDRRKRLFAVRELIPPSEERDAELLAYYEEKKEKGLIKKLPRLEDIPGSTKYKPHEENKLEPAKEEKKDFPEWVKNFTYSAVEGQSTPCVHCKVGLAPSERVSCNDCYIKLWQCKAFSVKGEPCKSFASQYGPYCKRHLNYRPKTEKK
jgi:hypothetical protein